MKDNSSWRKKQYHNKQVYASNTKQHMYTTFRPILASTARDWGTNALRIPRRPRAPSLRTSLSHVPYGTHLQAVSHVLHLMPEQVHPMKPPRVPRYPRSVAAGPTTHPSPSSTLPSIDRGVQFSERHAQSPQSVQYQLVSKQRPVDAAVRAQDSRRQEHPYRPRYLNNGRYKGKGSWRVQLLVCAQGRWDGTVQASVFAACEASTQNASTSGVNLVPEHLRRQRQRVTSRR